MDKKTILAMAMAKDIKVRKFRHDLHQCAELALEEHETASYIRNVLTENGIAYNCFGTGTIAEIGSGLKGQVLALRADIDALPITEPVGFPYRSKNEGCMHACGHDCHASMLLASAIAAHENEQELVVPVRFIFQPAEENHGGAVAMISAGCLNNVSAIYCLHMQSNRSIGNFATRKFCIHASSDGFIITVQGKSAHGASPNEGVDAIWVASQIIIALQGLISRETSAFDNAVLTIGKINGGTARNVLCDEVVMDGTLRTTDKKLRETLVARINEVVKTVASSMRAVASFEIVQSYASCVNNEKATDRAVNAVVSLYGKDKIELLDRPSMGGEDFGFYEEIVPGCKLYLGTGSNSHIHTSEFNINEDSLVYGVGFFLSMIFNYHCLLNTGDGNKDDLNPKP